MTRVLVIGLGRSGRSASRLLARTGNDVIAVDSQPGDFAELEAAGVRVVVGEASDVLPVDLVVKSPGVPADNPLVRAARTVGTPVWSEVELAARHLTNPVVAVTGTNGKTTTTELVAHLLRAGGRNAVACGNQGLPVCDLVGTVDDDAWLVIECSSFQLEDIHAFHPRAAVLLNITPDHLDRHGTLEAYRDAKRRIFENLTADDLAIAPADVDIPGAAAHRILVEGTPGDPRAIAWSEGGLHLDGPGRVCSWQEVPLPGAHNRQNVMASAAIASFAGVEVTAIAEGLRTFPGVPHRLEVVAEHEGVRYVNDSKATNPDAAIAALDAYPDGVHLIAGGTGKGTSFVPMAKAAQGVRRAYLIGQTADELAAAFTAQGVPIEMCGTLEVAVRAASAHAHAGDVVLLAPGCASFDQFTSFEHRGEVFRQQVPGSR